MDETCFICDRRIAENEYDTVKGLFNTLIHRACDNAIKRNPAPKYKEPTESASFNKYLKDFESGKANPAKIKVKITMHDGFQILSPAKLTPQGNSKYATKKAKDKES